MVFKPLIPFGRASGLGRWADDDPFITFRRDMDRMVDEFARSWNVPAAFGDAGFMSPKVNVAETEKGLEVTAELPGIDQKDIELDISDNVLTLKAQHKVEKEEKDETKRYHLVERTYGTFLRRFALPFEANTQGVEAQFDKGVLKIFVPRAPHAEKKAQRIPIKGN